MKNKKFLFVLIVVLFLLLIFSFFVKNKNTPEETYNLYQNSKYGYEILYPSNSYPFDPTLEGRDQISKNTLSINDIQIVQFKDNLEGNRLFSVSVVKNKNRLSSINFLVDNCKLSREEQCLIGNFNNLKTNNNLDYLLNTIMTKENVVTNIYYFQKEDNVITIMFSGIQKNDQNELKLQARIINSFK